MYARPWRLFLIGLLLIAAVAAAGYYGYQTGITRGLAEGAGLTAPDAGAVPLAPYAPYFYPRPFGFGFLGCLIPFLFLFLFFGLLKGLAWGGRGGWGPGHGMGWRKFGPEGSEAPPMFREWHRRAHESEGGGGAKTDSPQV